MFFSAALFNLIAAGALGAGRLPLFSAVGISPAPQLWFDLTLTAVALFGYGYYRVARDLNQTLMVELGALGKLLFVAIVLAHWMVGDASWHLPALVMVDFAYALLFLDFLRNKEHIMASQEDVME